jgi:hypothetical protein
VEEEDVAQDGADHVSSAVIWEAVVEPTGGEVYYINTSTNDSQWERPPSGSTIIGDDFVDTEATVLTAAGAVTTAMQEGGADTDAGGGAEGGRTHDPAPSDAIVQIPAGALVSFCFRFGARLTRDVSRWALSSFTSFFSLFPRKGCAHATVYIVQRTAFHTQLRGKAGVACWWASDIAWTWRHPVCKKNNKH